MMRDVVWMLISTVAKKEWFFETRAVLAHQSWGRHETLIYVVEETEQTVKRWSGCRAVDMGVIQVLSFTQKVILQVGETKHFRLKVVCKK